MGDRSIADKVLRRLSVLNVECYLSFAKHGENGRSKRNVLVICRISPRVPHAFDKEL